MANVKVLIEGYTSADQVLRKGVKETCPTITLVQDGEITMVVDPGVLPDQQLLVNALAKENLAIEDVNMVCVTHSHIDHYRNVGMFKQAKVLEYFGIWDAGYVQEWQEHFTNDIRIIKTPGHDQTGITLLVKTEKGTVAICGDVFWKKSFPDTDPYASDQKKLQLSRELVLKMSDWIIPGHAGMYQTANRYRFTKGKVAKKIEPVLLPTCRYCHKPFKKPIDRCICREWLCYRCCLCDDDCLVCNCAHHKKRSY